jgi:hypothetical protein
MSSESEDLKTGNDKDDDDDYEHKRSSAGSVRSLRLEPPIQRLKSFLMASELPSWTNHSAHSKSTHISARDEPIADLFPECTVLFADIAGFTAWSSVREPAQLLETIYQSFDRIAKKRAVFKVETIGDCYVAVTGLPEPQQGKEANCFWD